MIRRPSFTVLSNVHYKDGQTWKWTQVFNKTPEQQLQLFNQSLVGYDPYHPDGPNNGSDMVWKTPEKYKIDKPDKPA